MRKQGEINWFDKMKNNKDSKPPTLCRSFIIMLVLAIVAFVIEAIVSYGVATSDLPFWVKYWFLS